MSYTSPPALAAPAISQRPFTPRPQPLPESVSGPLPIPIQALEAINTARTDAGEPTGSCAHSSSASNTRARIPIILLKTKSSPSDSYEEYFHRWSEQLKTRAVGKQGSRDRRQHNAGGRRSPIRPRPDLNIRSTDDEAEAAIKRKGDPSGPEGHDGATASFRRRSSERVLDRNEGPLRSGELRAPPGASQETGPREAEGIRVQPAGDAPEGAPLQALQDRRSLFPHPLGLTPDPQAPAAPPPWPGPRSGGLDDEARGRPGAEQDPDRRRDSLSALPGDPGRAPAGEVGAEEARRAGAEQGGRAGEEVPVREGVRGDLEEDTGLEWDVSFCPVLTTTFDTDALALVEDLILGGQDQAADQRQDLDGLILTSQRAAEGLLSLLPSSSSKLQTLLTPKLHDDVSFDRPTPLQKLVSGDLPIFVIGPATFRLLSSHPLVPPISLIGRETGNGEALAAFILSYFVRLDALLPPLPTTDPNPDLTPSPPRKRTLLFPTGDPHRDIIPRTLSDPSLPESQRIDVLEPAVYRTIEDPSFAARFQDLLHTVVAYPRAWFVVFSPQGCAAMIRLLRAEGLLPPVPPQDGGAVQGSDRSADGGKDRGQDQVRQRKVFVATIGPTTADYLRRECGFEPDVVAERPSPEGIRLGIESFEGDRGDRE